MEYISSPSSPFIGAVGIENSFIPHTGPGMRPLNEPMIAAEYCGKLGQWPPYFTVDSGYARLILQLVQGQQLAMQRLRAIVPGCVLVAVELALQSVGRIAARGNDGVL